MRKLITIGFTLCLLYTPAAELRAQYQNPDWIQLAPAGESFRISVPNQPRVEKENVGAVIGKRYTALTGLASYTIWSLANANYRANENSDEYLDASAELVWEGLLKPARERLDDQARLRARMTYVRELPTEGLPGREYTLSVGDLLGTTEIFVAQEHIYVMLVMGKPGGDWPTERFFASFRGPSASPSIAPTKPLNYGVGPGSRARDGEDYNRIFSGREVTQKARVLEKPEPTYTESARKFGVTGTVVLRGVFSKDGEVTNLQAIRKLPHGLTQASMAAARAIRFTPATKDGQPVSMWMELQYNFNLY